MMNREKLRDLRIKLGKLRQKLDRNKLEESELSTWKSENSFSPEYNLLEVGKKGFLTGDSYFVLNSFSFVSENATQRYSNNKVLMKRKN